MTEVLKALDSRFKADPGDSNYYVVLCARRSDNAATKPGHAFVVWGKEDAELGMSSQRSFGFYPEEGSGFKAVFSTVPGNLINEATRFSPSALLTARIILRVDKQTFEASQIEIERWQTSDYNLYKRNCISFAKAVASQLALQGFPSDQAELPSDYFEQLISGVSTAFGGNWKSMDAAGRFALKISGPDIAWTEYGAGSLSKTAVAHSTSNSIQLRIERQNTVEVLTFLGFSSPSLRAEILAKNPEPSYLLLKRNGNKCTAEWHGLLVRKLPNGGLNQIVQPSQSTAKHYEFTQD